MVVRVGINGKNSKWIEVETSYREVCTGWDMVSYAWLIVGVIFSVIMIGNLVRGTFDGLGHKIRLCFGGSSVKESQHGLSSDIGGRSHGEKWNGIYKFKGIVQSFLDRVYSGMDSDRFSWWLFPIFFLLVPRKDFNYLKPPT